MIRTMLFAAIAASGLSAGGASAATVGTFGIAEYGGRFVGEDLNGDRMITTSELSSFRLVIDNRVGSPGDFYIFSRSTSDFLFRFLSDTTGVVSGWADYTKRVYFCGGWDQDPCEPGDPYTYDDFWMSTHFSFDDVRVSPAPVPLPGGLALMAGALAGFGFLRRRQVTA